MNTSREGINVAANDSNLVATTHNFVAYALGLVANAHQILTNIPLKHSKNIKPYHQHKATPLKHLLRPSRKTPIHPPREQ